MKKHLLFLCVAFVVALLACTSNAEELRAIGTVTITNSSAVNIRSAGDAEASVVAKGNPGQVFVCTGVSDSGWYEVLLDGGKAGYVSSKVASINDFSTSALDIATTSDQLLGSNLQPDDSRSEMSNMPSRAYATLNEYYVRLLPGQEYILKINMPTVPSQKLSITWYSDNPAVATFDNGVIRAHAPGEAQVMAIVNGNIEGARQMSSCLVRVAENAPVVYALLAGVFDYPGEIDDLGSPEQSIQTMQELINSICPTVGTILPLRNPTAAEFRSALGGMPDWGITDDDTTYIYYNGHGDIDGMHFSDGGDAGTISYAELKRHTDRLPGIIVIILETCFSGTAIHGVPQEVFGQADGETESQSMKDRRHRYKIITSSSNNTTSTGVWIGDTETGLIPIIIHDVFNYRENPSIQDVQDIGNWIIDELNDNPDINIEQKIEIWPPNSSFVLFPPEYEQPTKPTPKEQKSTTEDTTPSTEDGYVTPGGYGFDGGKDFNPFDQRNTQGGYCLPAGSYRDDCPCYPGWTCSCPSDCSCVIGPPRP